MEHEETDPRPTMTAQHLGQVMAHLKGAHRSLTTARHMLGNGDYDLEYQLDRDASMSERLRDAIVTVESMLYLADRLRDIRTKQEAQRG
jgi:hypothetical protein